MTRRASSSKSRTKGLAPRYRWSSYHTLRSKGSTAGYPDRTCVRDRILFAELKTETGQVAPEQVVWLDRLAAAGGEVYLWRPSDLDEIVRVLSKEWFYEDGKLRQSWVGPGERWQPRSLWLPGTGRADTVTPVPKTIFPRQPRLPGTGRADTAPKTAHPRRPR